MKTIETRGVLPLCLKIFIFLIFWTGANEGLCVQLITQLKTAFNQEFGQITLVPRPEGSLYYFQSDCQPGVDICILPVFTDIRTGLVWRESGKISLVGFEEKDEAPFILHLGIKRGNERIEEFSGEDLQSIVPILADEVYLLAKKRGQSDFQRLPLNIHFRLAESSSNFGFRAPQPEDEEDYMQFFSLEGGREKLVYLLSHFFSSYREGLGSFSFYPGAGNWAIYQNDRNTCNDEGMCTEMYFPHEKKEFNPLGNSDRELFSLGGNEGILFEFKGQPKGLYRVFQDLDIPMSFQFEIHSAPVHSLVEVIDRP